MHDENFEILLTNKKITVNKQAKYLFFVLYEFVNYTKYM